MSGQDFFRPWNSEAKQPAKPEKKLEPEEDLGSESDDSSSARSSSSYNSADSEHSALQAGPAAFHRPTGLAHQPAALGWEPLAAARLEDAIYLNGIAAEVDRINQQELAARQIKKTRPKNFSCHYCPAAFSNNGQLKGHLRTHTGEKPFRCNAEGCSRAFTRNEELTRHKRIHTGLKPYVCDLCQKKFGRKDHLKKHFKTHNRYPSTADYDFAYMASLLTGHYYGYYQPMPAGAYSYSFD